MQSFLPFSWFKNWLEPNSILSFKISSATKVPSTEEASRGTPTRPCFEDLPLQVIHPKASAWGLWGVDDERGSLNLLTPDVVRRAREEVQYGIVVSLNLPINVPRRPMNPRRKKCEHRIIAKGHANDDEVRGLCPPDFSSTHWDGLRHFPYSATAQFYNGVTQADICGPEASDKIDIASRPLVGRGVLLDRYSYAQRRNITLKAFTNQAVPLSQLKEVVAEQKGSFRLGDILLVRTGWTAQYHALSAAEQDKLGGRDDRASCGIEATQECIKWNWDNAFAAVAGDTVAYEAWPSPKEWGVSFHEVLLSGWGMPIGECFDLETLSETCRKLQRWTFMFFSQPLHIPGGVASPANATAIF